jgi:hypothetical protein
MSIAVGSHLVLRQVCCGLLCGGLAVKVIICFVEVDDVQVVEE